MASNETNATTNATSCINENEVFLAPLLRWLIPVLVLAGILGNAMILIVLNSSQSMKTKPHLLLSAMAAADLAHTVLAFGLQLYVYEDVISSDSFSRIYHHRMKMPLIILINWMAMTSTWLAVAVTVERLIAIRYPLKARFVMRKRFIIAAIVVIAVVSLLVSSYYQFWIRSIVYRSCQHPGRKLYRLYSDRRLLYSVSRNLHSLLCSLVPVVLLFIFNGSLVYHLHRSQAFMRKFQESETRSRNSQMDMQDWPNNNANHNGPNNANNNANHNCNNNNGSNNLDSSTQNQHTGTTIRREYKVAMVVLVISLTSAFCLLPSAAIVVFDTVRLILNINATPWWYFQANDISNLLVLTEKVLDFFLYCLTSGYFRRRLIMVISARRRSSLDSHKTPIRRQSKSRKKQFFRGNDVNEANERLHLGNTVNDRRPSTSTLSTLSTFLGSATCRVRRSTASSDGSQKSPHLNSRKYLSVDGSQNGYTRNM